MKHKPPFDILDWTKPHEPMYFETLNLPCSSCQHTRGNHWYTGSVGQNWSGENDKHLPNACFVSKCKCSEYKYETFESMIKEIC